MAIVDESYNLNGPYFDGSSYVEWLESFTIDERVSDDRRLTYEHLLKTLWEIYYIPSIGNDDDRAAEGIELRRRYYNVLTRQTGVRVYGDAAEDLEKIFGRCRVLEMLVALSMRMYDLMQDLGVYNSVSRWFWEIMQCVGFDELDDISWQGSRDKRLVNEVCNSIMTLSGNRSSSEWGGGWFGLSEWKELEIWYQMHAYLSRFFE